MTLIVLIILLQIIVAGGVFLVLKHLLDRELEKAALEQLMSLKVADAPSDIYVYHGNALPCRIEKQLKGLIKSRFTHSEIRFEQLKSLKGGLMIKMADEILDFSVASRLENFWS